MIFRFRQRTPESRIDSSSTFSELCDALVAAEKASESIAADLLGSEAALDNDLPIADVRTARTPKDLIAAAAAAGAVILKVLEKDAKLRELYTDLLHKFAYLATVGEALVKLLDQIKVLEKSNPQRYLESISHLIREFLAIEASFAEHKRLNAWNRSKATAAQRLAAKQYAWLSAFYMNFSVFTALGSTAAQEAAGILDELAKLLAQGTSDRPAIIKGIKLAVQAVRCVRRIMRALTQLLKAIVTA